MSDRTKDRLGLLFGILFALMIAGGLGLYGAALWTGRTVFPAEIRQQFVNFIGIVMASAAPFVANWFLQRRVSERIDRTENRLKNGIGDVVANKVADKVIEKQNENGGGTA